MSKKNFKTAMTSVVKRSGGLNTVLGESSSPKKRRVGRPTTQTKEITKTSQDGTKEGETRATFIVNENLLEKLKGVAYWDRVMIKEVIATALLEYVERYEKKKGTIKHTPKK